MSRRYLVARNLLNETACSRSVPLWRNVSGVDLKLIVSSLYLQLKLKSDRWVEKSFVEIRLSPQMDIFYANAFSIDKIGVLDSSLTGRESHPRKWTRFTSTTSDVIRFQPKRKWKSANPLKSFPKIDDLPLRVCMLLVKKECLWYLNLTLENVFIIPLNLTCVRPRKSTLGLNCFTRQQLKVKYFVVLTHTIINNKEQFRKRGKRPETDGIKMKLWCGCV